MNEVGYFKTEKKHNDHSNDNFSKVYLKQYYPLSL